MKGKEIVIRESIVLLGSGWNLIQQKHHFERSVISSILVTLPCTELHLLT